MSADKLASFRISSPLWEKFQKYAKTNNTTASALLVDYIKSVIVSSSDSDLKEVNQKLDLLTQELQELRNQINNP